MLPPVRTRLATGFLALDTLLGGGWPTGMLTELLVPAQGCGELGLLSPALAGLTAPTGINAPTPAVGGRWIMLIALPWIPYAPGLGWQGLTLNRVLMVQVQQPPEVLWTLEETLRSNACAGVVAWVGATALQRGGQSLLQRLHLLAGKHQVWTVLIRSTRCRQERSPARLRLQLLCTAPGTLEVEVFKNAWRGTGTVTVHSRR